MFARHLRKPWEQSPDGMLHITDISDRFRTVGNEQNTLCGADIASATTIAPTFGIHRVTGTTAVVNITVPYATFSGTIILIPTALWTWTAAGNIGLAGSAVVGKALRMTYVPSQGKWYPDYIA